MIKDNQGVLEIEFKELGLVKSLAKIGCLLIVSASDEKEIPMKRCLTVLMIIVSSFLIGIPKASAESYPKACIAADKNDSCRSHNGITVYDAYYGGTNYVLHREDWIEMVGREYFYNMLNLAEKEGKLEIQRMADGCVDKVLIII